MFRHFLSRVNRGYRVPSRMLRLALLHLFHDIRGVGLTPADDGENTKLQDPFSHLALCVLYIHNSAIYCNEAILTKQR